MKFSDMHSASRSQQEKIDQNVVGIILEWWNDRCLSVHEHAQGCVVQTSGQLASQPGHSPVRHAVDWFSPAHISTSCLA